MHNARQVTGLPKAEARLQIAGFFLPAFLLVAAVSFLPLFYAIRQSLFDSNYLQLGDFVGFDNYIELFTYGNGLWFVAASILFVAGTLIVAVPVGIGLALLLSRPIRFRGVFRAILLFPWVVSQLVTGLLWMWFYDGRLGPVADFLNRLGIGFVNPLTDPALAMSGLVLANAWHSYPLIMLLTLAALQTIPAEVTEAARLDARSPFQALLKVTLPLVRNTVAVAAILTTLNTFNTVTIVIAMTGGGPAEATDVLGMRVFKEAFQFYNMDVASTIAVVIFTLNILFAFLFIRILRGEQG